MSAATATRVTIYRGRYRNDALERMEIAAEEHPGCEPEITGEPANWTATRLLMDGERREDVESLGFRNG